MTAFELGSYTWLNPQRPLSGGETYRSKHGLSTAAEIEWRGRTKGNNFCLRLV